MGSRNPSLSAELNSGPLGRGVTGHRGPGDRDDAGLADVRKCGDRAICDVGAATACLRHVSIKTDRFAPVADFMAAATLRNDSDF